jgi:integrase
MTGPRRGNNEGSIHFDDKRGRWVAVLTVKGTGKRKFLYSRISREDVADKLAIELGTQAKGGLVQTDARTLASYVAEWLETTVKTTLTPATYRVYEWAFRVHINPVIGSVRLTKVDRLAVQKLQAALLKKGLSKSSVQICRASLSTVLTDAFQSEIIARNAVGLVRKPSRSDEDDEPVPMAPEQAQALLAAASGHHFRDLYEVLLTTGLRISEALGLQWSDIDLGAGTLRVTRQIAWDAGGAWRLADTKSRSGRRTIPLAPAAVAALQRERARQLPFRMKHRDLWPERWDFCFTNQIGRPYRAGSVESSFKAHVKAAGLPEPREGKPFTPHSLRHSCGTYLIAAGVSDRVVQAILGHSSATMTRHYTHALPSMMEAARDGMAAMWPGSTGAASASG